MVESIIFVGMLVFIYALMFDSAKITGARPDKRPMKLFDFTRPPLNAKDDKRSKGKREGVRRA
ncbi:hypothetical protein WNB94_05320 [Aquabacterium sp. A3]|uniref:hypothetical protein n=1 Tax=Aquabacterium sp. A3 TaxID=3132829 RepID=UPI003119E691